MTAADTVLAPEPAVNDIDARIAAINWNAVHAGLDAQGAAVIPELLAPAACRGLAAMYPQDECFRSRVVMARHGFGRGEYRYFASPLPSAVERLRTALYPPLVPVANRWHEAMDLPVRFPSRHVDFIARCHADGQVRPTPLLLQYGPGDYNCLHQDVYGEHVFPLQVVVLLSAPGRDFDGGEFVMRSEEHTSELQSH